MPQPPIAQLPSPEGGFALKTMRALHTEAPEPPHRHAHYTIIWVQQGQGTHFIDFKAYPIAPGTLFFLSPDQVHQVVAQQVEGPVLLLSPDFLFTHALAPEVLAQLGLFHQAGACEPVRLPPAQAPTLAQVVLALEAELAVRQPYHNEALGALLRLFMLHSYRAKRAGGQGASPTPATKTARLVQDFKRLVETQYRQWHKVGDFAERLYVSPDYLTEIFKAETGQAAKEFIQDRIMLEAKRLAHFTQQTTKEVAYQLGFDDPAHFSKFFKNCAGVSFSEFKEQQGQPFVH
ncbi:MAG: AraC family transcriptional regulator [Bernardetiaceae bacterium]|jgi:AraC-like DNA-binding protein|nr:AraC family transcriptional regulator [Bernardetiaceae bacterium]